MGLPRHPIYKHEKKIWPCSICGRPVRYTQRKLGHFVCGPRCEERLAKRIASAGAKEAWR